MGQQRGNRSKNVPDYLAILSKLTRHRFYNLSISFDSIAIQ